VATTRTSTYTFTRIEAVKLQFKHALLYASEYDANYINLLLECVEKHYIESFTFYGLNGSDQCEVEFTIKVDWTKFQVAVTADNNVYLSSRTTNEGISTIISDWTEAYLKIIANRNLSMSLVFTYTDEVENNSSLLSYVRQSLNSKRADPVTYARKFETNEKFKVVELPEMSGSLRF